MSAQERAEAIGDFLPCETAQRFDRREQRSHCTRCAGMIRATGHPATIKAPNGFSVIQERAASHRNAGVSIILCKPAHCLPTRRKLVCERGRMVIKCKAAYDRAY